MLTPTPDSDITLIDRLILIRLLTYCKIFVVGVVYKTVKEGDGSHSGCRLEDQFIAH